MLRNQTDTHNKKGDETQRRKALATNASKLIKTIRNTPRLANEYGKMLGNLVIIRDTQSKTASGDKLHKLENTVKSCKAKIDRETGQSSKFTRGGLAEGIQ